jgi:hypothetical protein
MHKETNDDGMKLIQLTVTKGMVMSSICIPHKQIYKKTWLSPDRAIKNQTDHVLINKTHAMNLCIRYEIPARS